MATLAQVQAMLDSLKLGFLGAAFKQAAQDQKIDVADLDQLGTFIDTYPDETVKKAFSDRFSGNKMRVANGLTPLSYKDYIARENEYVTRLANNGLPVGFYDQPEDLAKLIGGGVSAVEFNNRITVGYQAAMSADPATKAALRDLYGITDADLAAYYLDPTKATDSVLASKKNATTFGTQIAGAQIAGQAQSQAGMGLNAAEAEALAAQGVTMATARQGFSNIAQERELYGTTTAEAASGETGITTTEQIGAALGTNAAAAQRVAARRRKRTAAFEAGGSLAVTQQGATGLKTVGQ
jgi:hypothetical protein